MFSDDYAAKCRWFMEFHHPSTPWWRYSDWRHQRSDDWEARPSAKTRERLLEYGKEIFPGDEVAFDVVTDIVGRRPGRTGGMRLEVGRKIDANGHTKPIVHAYGAGGRGYEISWGVAAEVLGLVRDIISSAD